MRICPTCRTAYPARGRATCAKDGTRLVGAEEFAAAQKDPLIGTKVAGRFLVKERVGTGGMGTVYRAEQAGLHRPVALKVLKKELISDRDTVARFHREAKAMSMLMHPNTVRVFDFGEDDAGHLFLAMELLEGELLTAWIEREGTAPVKEAIEVVREILRSLGEAHSKALIHRDLKPDNIFLARVEGSARPVVKVLDFGIAKVFREEHKIDQLETQAGTVFGTPRYMSPEQAQGNALDHRSDLYAVGVLLYQLLTGRPPFVDDDAVVVMAKHIREAPEPPRAIASHQPIPRRLERAVLRALAKEPDGRFDNADAFEAELTACLPEVDEEAARLASGRSERFVDTVGDLPRVPLAIGAAVLLVAVVLAGMVVMSGEPEVVPPPPELAAVSPSPPTEAPAPSMVPSVAEPALTDVELRSEPAGAEIWEEGARIGTTPYTFSIEESRTRALELRLPAHEPEAVQLTAASGPSRVISLRRVRRPVSRGRAPSRAEATPEPPPPSGGGDPYEQWQ